jgi:hypothetical protein
MTSEDVSGLMQSVGTLRLSLLSSHLLLLQDLHGTTESAFASRLSTTEERFAQAVVAVRKQEGMAGSNVSQQFFEATQALAVETTFPHLQRNALFVMAYGATEHELLALCDDCRNAFPRAVTVTDLQGRGFKKARTYLTKVAGLILPTGPEWSDLMTYGTVRNAIIHERGRIAAVDRAKVLELARSTGTFELLAMPGEHVLPHSDFLSRFCETVEVFTGQLSEAWKRRWE